MRGRLAPWPVGVLAVVLALVFAWQVLFVPLDRFGDYGVSALALRRGRWWTLLTAMFVHANLMHLVMNVSALPLGAPVWRRLAGRREGAALFFGLYLACGLAGWLAYVALDPAGRVPAVGASGAIFGLWGAGARLGPDEESWAPLLSRQVGAQVRAAVGENLSLVILLAVLSLGSHGGGLRLAWQAHAGGFLAGLLLVRPLAGRASAA